MTRKAATQSPSSKADARSRAGEFYRNVIREREESKARTRSKQIAQMLSELASAPPVARRDVMRTELTEKDVAYLLSAAAREMGTPYGLYRDDPVGFTEDILGETAWSLPKQVLAALPHHRKVAVPAGFGVSKTWSAGRAVAWWSCVHPPGNARVVTIAPLMRQVQRQVWPEIRAAHAKGNLPGHVDMTQWKIPTSSGMDVVVAYGFSASPYNEAAVQGVHSANLLVVVDEAGGMHRTIGTALRGLLTGESTRLLAIGNPPTNDEGSWFEQLCAEDDVYEVRIPATASPNLTGEVTEACRTCPDTVPEHPLASHLVDRQWVADTIREHGQDSAFVSAKVHARFPRGAVDTAIPSTWVDLAADWDEPTGDDWVRLRDLGLPGEPDVNKVRKGAWVRLGVDVAADGGDELAIARTVGDLATIRHVSAGAANTNPVDVAGVVLQEIRAAEALREKLETQQRVRVKIDAIGVGWGVAGILETWAAEGVHSAEIVRVVVSEKPNREDESATLRPARKRDEMWLAMRDLLRPGPDGEPAGLRLAVDRRTCAQLSAPRYGTSSAGRTVIEKKVTMKARGVPSPDRAEAAILAVYEVGPSRRKARLVV